MNRKLGLPAFVVSLGIACTPAAAAYTSIFAFGDSLSDAGNLFAESGSKIPLKPYVDGHFSNGPTWVEDLSQMLGLGPMKPFLTSNNGTNYAFGGAQTGITDINPFDPSARSTSICPTRSPHSILWIPTRSKARCIRWTLAPMTS